MVSLQQRLQGCGVAWDALHLQVQGSWKEAEVSGGPGRDQECGTREVDPRGAGDV